jgi:hypothetical protein
MESIFGGLIEFNTENDFDEFVKDINEKNALSIIEKAFEYGHHNNLYTVQETYFIYKCLKKLKDDANKNQRDHLHNDDTNGDIS